MGRKYLPNCYFFHLNHFIPDIDKRTWFDVTGIYLFFSISKN